jgi:hypothetical protein
MESSTIASLEKEALMVLGDKTPLMNIKIIAFSHTPYSIALSFCYLPLAWSFLHCVCMIAHNCTSFSLGMI